MGPLRAEVAYGESERFTAPILFVHGLWSDAYVWRGFTGFLTHRGWRCVAVHLRQASQLAEHADDLRAVIASLDAPPILIGHDLGALLAIELAACSRAVVALAPLVPLPLGRTPVALLRAGGLIARWRARSLRAPRGRWRAAYPGADRARESASLIRQLTTENIAVLASPETPAFVVRGDRDPVVTRGDTEQLAGSLGADTETLSVPGGHALPLEDGWQETAGAVHRWVVRRLGAPLLEFYENEDQYPV